MYILYLFPSVTFGIEDVCTSPCPSIKPFDPHSFFSGTDFKILRKLCFSIYPFLTEYFFWKIRNGIRFKKYSTDVYHTFHPTSEMWRNSNFRSRLGGIKSAPEMTNQLLAAEIHSSLGFQPGRVVQQLKVDVVVIRCEFLLIFWRFCNLSAVDFQDRGFLISEDEDAVDLDSRLLDHFRGGREKGEIICYVVGLDMKDSLFSLDKHSV